MVLLCFCVSIQYSVYLELPVFAGHGSSFLPAKHRIIFKTLVLLYKFLTTWKPKYFAPYLSLYASAVKMTWQSRKDVPLGSLLQFLNS